MVVPRGPGWGNLPLGHPMMQRMDGMPNFGQLQTNITSGFSKNIHGSESSVIKRVWFEVSPSWI